MNHCGCTAISLFNAIADQTKPNLIIKPRGVVQPVVDSRLRWDGDGLGNIMLRAAECFIAQTPLSSLSISWPLNRHGFDYSLSWRACRQIQFVYRGHLAPRWWMKVPAFVERSRLGQDNPYNARAILAAGATTALFGCIWLCKPSSQRPRRSRARSRSKAGARAMSEDLADVAVPALGDATELLLASGRVFTGDKAQPCAPTLISKSD